MSGLKGFPPNSREDLEYKVGDDGWMTVKAPVLGYDYKEVVHEIKDCTVVDMVPLDSDAIMWIWQGRVEHEGRGYIVQGTVHQGYVPSFWQQVSGMEA